MSAGVRRGVFTHELEYAPGTAAMVATLAHRRGGDLAGELGEGVATLVMRGGDRRERTDGAREHDAVGFPGGFVGTAELVERAGGGGGARGEGSVEWSSAEGKSAAGGPEERDEIAGWHPVSECRHEIHRERRVGGGEMGLGGGGDPELVCGFASGAPVAHGAIDETVSLEESELGADGIGGDTETSRELLGGGWLSQELVEDRSPGIAERGADSVGNRHVRER